VEIRLQRAVAVVLLALFCAAGLHLLVPHEFSDDHGQACALCALFWSVAALVVVYVLRRRHLGFRPYVPFRILVPALTRIRPWAERAPPSLAFS